MIRRFDFVVVDIDSAKSLDERRAYAAAQQIQLQQHLAPTYEGDATMKCRAATPDAPPLPGEVQIRLVKHAPTDPAGALGYHDQLPDGTPVIYVFIDLAALFNTPWTSIASHEVVEVVGDARLRLAVETPKGFCARELADAVEGDMYFIDVELDGTGNTWHVAMSNFCTPEWFEPSPTPSADEKYDWMGLCKTAGEVRPNGGYAQYYDSKKGWVQEGQMRGYRAHLADLGLGRGARRAVRSPDKGGWLSRLVARIKFWFATR